jgi:hypothetical protein
MMKRILLSLVLAASVGGAITACTNNSATPSPIESAPAISSPAESAPAASAPAVASPSESPAESVAASPSSS